MIGYAFQIYTLFVANSRVLKENYKLLAESILSSAGNWGSDMKYLIPSLSNFAIAIIFKYPDLARANLDNILNIIKKLIGTDIRMEQ
jgi:hypothetical protein